MTTSATTAATADLAPPASRAHADYVATSYFGSLEGLRTLAILPVIWHHCSPHQLEGVLGRGPLGVHLFFAISGFLITSLLLRERDAIGRISLLRFHARRMLRIFPLYYAVLGLYVVWSVFLPSDQPSRAHFFESLPAYATYTTNWFVDFDVSHPVLFMFSWSLATEEQFYLLWPAAMRFARWRYTPVVLSISLLALDHAVDVGMLAAWIDPAGTAHRMITSISAPICLGVLLAQALHDERVHGWVRRVLGHRVSAPLAIVTLLVLLWADDTPLLLVHLAMVALVGAVCIRRDNGLSSFLELRPMRWVGKVSYGMYLLHISAIWVAKAVLPPDAQTPGLLFVIALPVTLVFAGASFRYFERPLLSLRSRFRAPAPA